MPKITKDYLINYNKALIQTLDHLLFESSEWAKEAQAKLTLKFMIEYNQKILDILNHTLSSRSAAWAEAQSALLLIDNDIDIENKARFSMLSFYQEVAKGIEKDPMKVVYEHEAHTAQKSARIILSLMLCISVVSSTLNAMLNKEPNANFYYIAMFMMIIAYPTSRCLSYVESDVDELQIALQNLQDFGQKKEYTQLISTEEHKESVQTLKKWFEDRNVFFSNSLAEIVDENVNPGATRNPR